MHAELSNLQDIQKIRGLLPKHTVTPDQAAEDLWQLFGARWEEAVSLLGKHTLDPAQQPLIRKFLAAGLPLPRMADWLWDGRGLLTNPSLATPEALAAFLITQSVTRPSINAITGWHLRTVYEEHAGQIPESALHELLLATAETLSTAKNAPTAYNEHGRDDFRQPYSALDLPNLELSGSLQPHQLEFGIASQRAGRKKVFGVWLTDPALLNQLPPAVRRHANDGKLLIASVRYHLNGPAMIGQIQAWLPLSRYLSKPVRKQLGNLGNVAEESFRHYIATKTRAPFILAPPGYRLYSTAALPLHPNTVERVNKVFIKRGYGLYLHTDGQWWWRKEFGTRRLRTGA